MPWLFDEEEFNRWFNQAEHTLKSAEKDMKSGDYNWACFKCQQAGEYGVKALLRGLGKPALGNCILKLLGKLKEAGISIPNELEEWGRSLDRHYVPPRYPNAYPAGSPFEFYDEKVAMEAIESAWKILEFIGDKKGKNDQSPEREKERERALQLAREYVRRLKEVVGPLSGILYGSFARGDFNLGSDIDVLIISDSLPEHPMKRMEFLYHYIESGIEPKGYTRDEFRKMLKSHNATALNALREGMVLWDDGFLKELPESSL